jgi:hypothetical protein
MNENQIVTSPTHVQRRDGHGSKSQVEGNPTHARREDRHGSESWVDGLVRNKRQVRGTRPMQRGDRVGVEV